MCEPCHSIVQFPSDDGDDRSSGTPNEQRLSKSGWGEWLRKIGSWLHLSKMGNGHNEAIGKTTLEHELYLPRPTFYEVDWWKREMHIDGAFRGAYARMGRNFLEAARSYDLDDKSYAVRKMLEKEAKDAAQQYANAVSIGNMTTLRRFLTSSIQKSDCPTEYVSFFEMMLNKDGRDMFSKKIKEFTFRCGRVTEKNVDRVTKILMWFTRKRELLVPEWADDHRLWVPGDD